MSGHKLYTFKLSELVRYTLMDVGSMALLGYLFYRNFFMILLLVVIGTPFLILRQREECLKRQKEALQEQFKDCILSLAASLRAGYSVENCFGEICSEMITLYGQNSMIVKAVKDIINKLKLSVPIEELLEELGRTSKIEDVKSFASVFKTAKRSGGDMVSIITQTAKTIGDKFDMQREISTMLAAKRLEQRLMLVMPVAIIAYISFFNSGFLDILYEAIIGRVIMSVCLIVYAMAFFIGEKIVSIEI